MAVVAKDIKVRPGMVPTTVPGMPVSTIEVPSTQSVAGWWNFLQQLSIATGVVILRPSCIDEMDKEGYLFNSDFLSEVYEVIDNRPMFIISVIKGPIRSAMMMFPAISSLVLATPESTFGFPESTSDSITAPVNMAMKKRINEQVLRRLMLVGDTIDAAEAQRFGLVDYIGNETHLENEVARMIYKNCSPQTQYYMSKPDLLKAMMDEEEEEDK